MSDPDGSHPWQTHPDGNTPDEAPPARQDPPEAVPAARADGAAPVAWDDVMERLEELSRPRARRRVPVRGLGALGVAVLLLGGWLFLRSAGRGEWVTQATLAEGALASSLQGGAPEPAYFRDPGAGSASAGLEPPPSAGAPVTPAAAAGEPAPELEEEIQALRHRLQELEQIQSLRQRVRELEQRLASGDRPAALPPAAASRAAPSRETPPVRETASAPRAVPAAGGAPLLLGVAVPSEPPPAPPLANRVPSASAAAPASRPLSVRAPAEAAVTGTEDGVTAPRVQNGRTVSRRLTARYPAALRQQGVGGTVSLRLVVNEAGRVVRSQLQQSSGHGELDALALQEAGALQFAPARRNGVPVRAVVEVPIVLSPGRQR
jgi:protein TonB